MADRDLAQLRGDWGGGGFVCPCACVCACEIACALAWELRDWRRIPHPGGDRRLADLPTYLRSIEVWS